jgi:hypothetical protein
MDKYGEGKREFYHLHAIAIDSKDHENTYKFTKKGKFVKSWSQFVNEECQLKEDHIMIFDSKDNWYIKYTQTYPIQVFSPINIYIKRIGKKSTDDGEFILFMILLLMTQIVFMLPKAMMLSPIKSG